jgi:transposase
VRRLPKLSLAVATSCHLILAARATTGGGSDHPHFEPLLFDAWRRADVAVAVADAGYDSAANHRIGRLDMGVQTVIPPDIGRPSAAGPTGEFRAEMRERFDRPAHDETYGQRWQVETVNSMVKRNLGSALRATTARRRSMELLLRVLTHNIMVLEGTEP